MIYEEKIECRSLNILRLQVLNSLQSPQESLPIYTFLKLLQMVIPSISSRLTEQFVSSLKIENTNEVSYKKLCELINYFKYKPFLHL